MLEDDNLSVVDVPTKKHRMDVRLGEHSFTAEGSEEKCDEQYQRFLDAAIAFAGASTKPAQVASNLQLAAPALNKQDSGEKPAQIEAVWDRAYKRKDNRLSLITLPSTSSQKADGILLLLYGFQTLLEQDAVSCMDLMDAAKQSGLRIDRVDRTMPASYKIYYHRGGSGKGMRYSLNNVGLRRAQEILEKMYES